MQVLRIARIPVRGTFVPLLASLVGILVVSPFAADHPLLGPILVSILLLSAVLGFVGHQVGRLVLMIGIGAAISMRWIAELGGRENMWLFVAGHATVTATLSLLAVMVLVRTLRSKRVTKDTVVGAVCAYLLIAYVFAFAFALLQDVDPTALSERPPSLGRQAPALLYFSFSTLTTLGYGDIVPVTPTARMLAMLEVLCGQLYLAAFVARLVGALGAAPVEPRDASSVRAGSSGSVG